MGWIERLLRRWFPFKEIGWEEIQEKFTRFQLLKTPWGNVYLHKLDAPIKHPHPHDHPWSFLAIILSGGYWECMNGKTRWQPPGRILWRPAETKHNVVTNGTNWSIVITTRKKRDWRLITEMDQDCRTRPDV